MMKNEDFAVNVVTEEQAGGEVSSLLTAEEEILLARKIAEGGEDGVVARNRLVEANLKLVSYFAKKYIGCGIDMEDLIIACHKKKTRQDILMKKKSLQKELTR